MCKEAAFKSTAARMRENSAMGKEGLNILKKKKKSTQPAAGRGRMEQRCPGCLQSSALLLSSRSVLWPPTRSGRGKTSRHRQEQGALCGFARYFRPSLTQEELHSAFQVSPSLAWITNLASGPGLGSSRAPHQTG